MSTLLHPLTRFDKLQLTNLDRNATTLYDDLYCARGEMEKRIKARQSSA